MQRPERFGMMQPMIPVIDEGVERRINGGVGDRAARREAQMNRLDMTRGRIRQGEDDEKKAKRSE